MYNKNTTVEIIALGAQKSSKMCTVEKAKAKNTRAIYDDFDFARALQKD